MSKGSFTLELALLNDHKMNPGGTAKAGAESILHFNLDGPARACCHPDKYQFIKKSYFKIRNYFVINTSYNVQCLLLYPVDSFECIHPIIPFRCCVFCRTRIYAYMRWKKIFCYVQAYSKAFLYILSASAILPLEKLLIFPPHSIIFSDLPEKNAFAAIGTLYFAAFILPKTIDFLSLSLIPTYIISAFAYILPYYLLLRCPIPLQAAPKNQ